MLAGLFSIGLGGLLLYSGFQAADCDNVAFGGRAIFCSGSPGALEASSGLPGFLTAGGLIAIGLLLVFVGLTRLMRSGRVH